MEIEGVNTLGDGEITVIPDRIEAGTYVIIGALLGKKLKIKGVISEHIDSLLYKLKEMGVSFKINGDTIVISKCKSFKPV
ncbi:MAG: UDP-N-acetylglucosamine 1-carboxyvinyltransferase, partial [Clostridia bacterium]|nr:UDP-N-acetylglucosamine 1-carboxyvinyltransferase [Clostridia bacterium]